MQTTRGLAEEAPFAYKDCRRGGGHLRTGRARSARGAPPAVGGGEGVRARPPPLHLVALRLSTASREPAETIRRFTQKQLLDSLPQVVVRAGPCCDETGCVPLDLILDCDPGHDDAVALAVAADRGRLLGVTTVAGNAALEDTTRNALAVVQLLGIDVEVHSGAATPLRGRSANHAAHVHGEHGLAGATLPPLRTTIASNDAAGFLVETTKQHPHAWIIATGPLTNVAQALRRDPTLPERIAGISIMGGGTFGNVTDGGGVQHPLRP